MGNTHSRNAFRSAYRQLGQMPQRVDRTCGVLCAEVSTIFKQVLAFGALLADERVEECVQRNEVRQYVCSDVTELNALLMQEAQQELQQLSDKALRWARGHCSLDIDDLAAPSPVPAKKVLLRAFEECCHGLQRKVEMTDTLRAEMDCARSLHQQHARLLEARGEAADAESRAAIDRRLETVGEEIARQERELETMRAASFWNDSIHGVTIRALRAVMLLHALLTHAAFAACGAAAAGCTGSATLGDAGLALSYATLVRAVERAAVRPASARLSDEERAEIFERLSEGLRARVLDAMRRAPSATASEAAARLRELLAPLNALALRTFQYSEGRRLEGFATVFAAETLFRCRADAVEATLLEALVCLQALHAPGAESGPAPREATVMKLTVLALHGFGGTFGGGDQHPMAALEAGLASRGVPVAITAPRAPSSVGDGSDRVAWLAGDQAPLGRHVGFWINDQRMARDGQDAVQAPLTAADLSDESVWHGVEGVDASLELLERAWAAAGGYDVLLGFSQGAMMAAMLCERLRLSAARPPAPRCVVLVSGFMKPLPEATMRWWPPSTPLASPSLHVLGELDTVVANCRSEELAALFSVRSMWRHTLIGQPAGYGGHIVPCDAPFLDELASFVGGHALSGVAGGGDG